MSHNSLVPLPSFATFVAFRSILEQKAGMEQKGTKDAKERKKGASHIFTQAPLTTDIDQTVRLSVVAKDPFLERLLVDARWNLANYPIGEQCQEESLVLAHEAVERFVGLEFRVVRLGPGMESS